MSANADKLARNAKVHDLHRELKSSVEELVGVTNEIRRGIDPIAVGREMMASSERKQIEQMKEPSSSGSGTRGVEKLMKTRETAATKQSVINSFRPNVVRAVTGDSVSSGSSEYVSNINSSPSHLPFSAVSLGRIKRLGPAVGGADVLADCWEEQAVAEDVARLANSGKLQAAVSKRTAVFINQGDEVVEDR